MAIPATSLADRELISALNRKRNWCWAGMIGSFVYEAGVNPWVPFGPLLLRTVPGWNIYLGDAPTIVAAAAGVVSVIQYFRLTNRVNRILKSVGRIEPQIGR